MKSWQSGSLAETPGCRSDSYFWIHDFMNTILKSPDRDYGPYRTLINSEWIRVKDFYLCRAHWVPALGLRYISVFSEIQTELANLPNFASKFGKLGKFVEFCKNQKSLNIPNFYFYFILECFKYILRTFPAQFDVLVVKTKHFSKIRQICYIQFGKTRLVISG